MNLSHLTIYSWVVGLLIFLCSSLFPTLNCSVNGLDLESGIYRPYRRLEVAISDEHEHDNGTIIGIVRPTQELAPVDQRSQRDTVPMAQHMASLPIWFFILHLGYFFDSESIIVQALNCIVLYFLVTFLQLFFGYYLILNLGNFPCVVQFERIDYSVGNDEEARSVEISRWTCAWLTEIAIILFDDYKTFAELLAPNFPVKPILIFIFIVQLLYIYSFQLGITH